jgi:hypothetical protein
VALALDGMKILDMARLGPGPHCAQIHGGIGFNEEVDTTLFLRRGKQYQLSMGDSGSWEDIIAEEILDR